MTFAVIPWLSISINLLLVVLVLISIFMILIILMQRPKQDGLGAAFGGGVTDQVFGARTTNVLQRATVYLGSAFFILSLVLSILIGAQNRTISAVTKKDLEAKTPPVVAPAVEVKKSLSEELPAEEPVPAEPPAPADVSPSAPVATPPVESAPAPEPAPAPTAPAPANEGDKPAEH